MFDKCLRCGREFKVNLSGKIRSHWCQPAVGDSKTMTFATGGTLTIRLEANWMLFGDAERALICQIIDAMHEYEQQHPSKKPVEPTQAVGAVDPVEGIVTG